MVCSEHPSYPHVARLEHADSGRAPVGMQRPLATYP